MMPSILRISLVDVTKSATADLVTFIEEIFNQRFHLLYKYKYLLLMSFYFMRKFNFVLTLPYFLHQLKHNIG